MEKKRIGYIDVARGIAMISIVLGHLGQPNFNRVVFTYDLPIFFLISGYFFDTDSSFSTFMVRKLRQLIVPYCFTCLLYLICSSCMNAAYHEPWNANLSSRLIACLYGAGDSWPQPFNISAIGAIWFLWALFWTSVALKLLLRLKPILRIASVAVLFCLSCWSWRIIWLPLSIQAGGCALLFVYIGYLLRKLLPKLRNASISFEIKAAGALLALAMWVWFIHTFTAFWLVHCEIGNGMSDIIGSLCGCVVLLLLSRCIERWARPLAAPLAFYGRYSLIFLSIHLVELNCVRYWEIYPRFLAMTGLADSTALFLGFAIAAKLAIITVIMLAIYRIPPIRCLYGYRPLEKKRGAGQNA